MIVTGKNIFFHRKKRIIDCFLMTICLALFNFYAFNIFFFLISLNLMNAIFIFYSDLLALEQPTAKDLSSFKKFLLFNCKGFFLVWLFFWLIKFIFIVIIDIFSYFYYHFVFFTFSNIFFGFIFLFYRLYYLA